MKCRESTGTLSPPTWTAKTIGRTPPSAAHSSWPRWIAAGLGVGDQQHGAGALAARRAPGGVDERRLGAARAAPEDVPVDRVLEQVRVVAPVGQQRLLLERHGP